MHRLVWLVVLLLSVLPLLSAFPNGLCRTAIVTSAPIAPGYVCASGGQMITITCFNTSVSYPVCVDGSGVNGTDLASDVTYFPVVPSDFDNLNQTTVDIALNLLGARRSPSYYGGNNIAVTSLNASSFSISFTGALSSAGIGFSLIANGTALTLNGLDQGPGVFLSQVGNDIVIESDIAFASSGTGDASLIDSSSPSSLTLNELKSDVPLLSFVAGGGKVTVSWSVICADGRPSIVFNNASYCLWSFGSTSPSASCNGGTAYTLYVNSTTPIASFCQSSAIVGTPNQVTVTNGPSTITLSTPSVFLAPGTIQDTSGLYYSSTTAIVAAGTTQGTATPLNTSFNFISAVPPNSGVVLPVPAAAGFILTILNSGVRSVKVYPANGGKIDELSSNTPVLLPVGNAVTYQAFSTTRWYTVSMKAMLYEPLQASNVGTLTQNNPGAAVFVTTIPAVAGSLTIPANLLVAGSKVVFSINGFFSTGVAGATLTWRIRLDGATVYGTSAASAVITSATNAALTIDAKLSIFTAGNAGTALVGGSLQTNGVSATVTSTATTGIDTTIDHAVDLQLAFSTLNAANTFTILSATVEHKRP